VTRAGPVLGGRRQIELVADGRDEVDADVDLVALGPVGDDALEDIVRPGDPVVPEAEAELGLGAGDVREPRDCRGGGPGGGGLQEVSTSSLFHCGPPLGVSLTQKSIGCDDYPIT
jgi:hypothetical protein